MYTLDDTKIQISLKTLYNSVIFDAMYTMLNAITFLFYVQIWHVVIW